jgi:hypothetical protein
MDGLPIEEPIDEEWATGWAPLAHAAVVSVRLKKMVRMPPRLHAACPVP